MSPAPPIPVKRRELIAVFDESGGESNVPGDAPAADFALSAIIFAGPRASRAPAALEECLKRIRGDSDYKYRRVRQSDDARRAVIDTLTRQSGLIRIFGYYAAGGAFVEQARRELHAVKSMDNGPDEVSRAESNLAKILADPRREGLRDAITTSVPAVSPWAASRKQRIKVCFDDRTDLASIAADLKKMIDFSNRVEIWGEAYRWMDWIGPCPTEFAPIARVADVLVGDFRATFKKYGTVIWRLVASDGFVRRHQEAIAAPDSFWSGLMPMPRIGFVSDDTWDKDWKSGSTQTTMFNAYRPYLLNGMATLFSPCGRGCLLKAIAGGFDVFQMMD